jgi:hypothetical protein
MASEGRHAGVLGVSTCCGAGWICRILIHRAFIVVGYDGDRGGPGTPEDQERQVALERVMDLRENPIGMRKTWIAKTTVRPWNPHS